jgi:hypothetical protein
VRVIFKITDITRDRRNKAQLASDSQIAQERLDQAVEREWRRRVQVNVQRRLERRVAHFLKHGVTR